MSDNSSQSFECFITKLSMGTHSVGYWDDVDYLYIFDLVKKKL